ncbi:hypothetical protein DAEQUDRAFT_750624 [Daedalea quercina L-15889]|uniref:DDX60-like winged helix domain-containing protein n=1 Tax=Daedalea quercina L-15889 TaxID=1314783 RepID=A0A165QVS6_9APHY|nr:hypothetical protein DAEQUDRAFT_750624 [Daedalea quercina L-15889]
MRFNIDYLRRAGLLDAEGNPINLFGIASHLYYTEPGNLALSDQHSVKREFLVLLCHLFGRRYLPSIYSTDENLQQLIKKSPSMVALPPMPEDAKMVLDAHDSDILSTYTSYALAYATQHHATLGIDSRLPLSDLKSIPAYTTIQEGEIQRYHTVEELSRTSRDGLHLNQFAIPSMRIFTSHSSQQDESYILNAYILDFYIHGQPAAIKSANGIRDNDMWYLLDDFTLTLKSIRAGLGQLLLTASTEAVGDDEDEDEAPEDAYTEKEIKATGDGDGVEEGQAMEADQGDDSEDEDMELTRPAGVSDQDWTVYKLVSVVTTEFEEKFRMIWA